MNPCFLAASISVGICSNEQKTIIHGASELLPLFPAFFGSFLSILLQKWKYSYRLKLKSELNAAFPAKYPRIALGWNDVAMMCFHELDVPNSLKMCLRVLVVINCEENFNPQFVYLKGAEKLRK